MGWPLLAALVAPADPDQLRVGLDVAEALRVVRREDRDGVPRFRMHRLVQEVRREERPVGKFPDMALVVLDRLGDWLEARRQDFSDLPAFEAELDHLDAWIGAADTLGTAAARVRLRWLRAYPSWHRGEYTRALDELDTALALFATAAGDRVMEAHLHADRGVILGELGEHRKALEMETRALDLRRELLGERHPDTAASYDNVGGTLSALGEHRKALEMATRALDLRRELLGERHPDTAASYNNVGGTWSALGEHRKALEMQTRALDLRRELLGERHPDTAASYHNVGATWSALGEDQKALEMQTRPSTCAGSSWASAIPTPPPPTTTWAAPGARWASTRRPWRWRPAPSTCAGSSWASAIPTPPPPTTTWAPPGARWATTGRPWRDAAVGPPPRPLLQQRGRAPPGRGRPRPPGGMQTRALDLRRELLGERHPDTATSYNNVGGTWSALGEHRKALEMQTRALDLRRELLGERHPKTVNSAISVLFSLRALGRKMDLFSLARDLVNRLPPSTSRYKEIVNAYNDACPPGFRRLGPEGPKGQTSKEKAKKRR
ncbi:MAG: tetratricopeptide repeat protein [Deltaproteobacteria bacterium]|nr:tetratricopeptide repeat protein [Deltaproteobacteria bacterium]